MTNRILASDIEMLRKAGVSEDDIQHCIEVAQKAVEIALRTKTEVDMEPVSTGALYHDFGRQNPMTWTTSGSAQRSLGIWVSQRR